VQIIQSRNENIRNIQKILINIILGDVRRPTDAGCMGERDMKKMEEIFVQK